MVHASSKSCVMFLEIIQWAPTCTYPNPCRSLNTSSLTSTCHCQQVKLYCCEYSAPHSPKDPFPSRHPAPSRNEEQVSPAGKGQQEGAGFPSVLRRHSHIAACSQPPVYYQGDTHPTHKEKIAVAHTSGKWK